MDSDSITAPEWVEEHGSGDYGSVAYITTVSPIKETTHIPKLQAWIDLWSEYLKRYYQLDSSYAGTGQVYTVLEIKGNQVARVQIRDCSLVLKGEEVLLDMSLNTTEKYECLRLITSTGKVDIYGKDV